MKQLSFHLRKFFLNPLPAQTLGAFRIAIAVFALAQLIILLPDWVWLYGPQGLIPWQISDALAIRQTPGLSALAKLFFYTGLSQMQTLVVVTVTYFLSLIGLLLGYRSHLMGGIAWITHLILNTTGHFTAYGVETFTHISLFYCMVLPVGISWAIGSERKAKRIPGYLSTLSIRILQIHLCIMYLASGLEKAMGYQWWNGEAIWIAMQQDQFHRIDIDWMAKLPIIPTVLCIGTLTVETLYPIGINWSFTRRFWLAAVLMMHLSIAIFLGLQLFGALMFLLNLTIYGEQCFPGLFTGLRKRLKQLQATRLLVFKRRFVSADQPQ